MKLYIKNMVCSRCKMVVKSELEKLGLHPVSVELGEVEIEEGNIANVKAAMLYNFHSLGFDLIDDKKSKVIEKVKNLIIDLVHNKSNALSINLSVYLSQHILQEYSTISKLFAEVEDTTIEKYFILQKIEKIKELIMYNELSLSEIAFMLNYSSVAHLSNQFKKATGLSPSHFKQMKDKRRSPIEDI